MKVETQWAIESLRSTECPSCHGRKGAKKSLCRSCFFTLPVRDRKALYSFVGEGYEEALERALSLLGPDLEAKQ